MAFWDYYDFEEALSKFVPLVAQVGFATALDMVGNNGQLSIIEMTGEGAFYEAAEASLMGGGGAADVLVSNCPHPDAVSEILDETGAVMDDLGEMIAEAVEAAAAAFEFIF